jgi:CHAT domain-containing protein
MLLPLALAIPSLPCRSQAQSETAKDLDALLLEGNSLQNAGHTKESIQILEKALKISRGMKDLSQEARALQFLSFAYRSSRDFDTVLDLRLKALDALTRDKHLHENFVSSALGMVSAAYVLRKDYGSATRYARQALEAAKKRSNQSDVWLARCLQQLGIVLMLDGRYADAELQLRAALAKFEAAVHAVQAVSAGLAADEFYEPDTNASRWLQQVLIAQKRAAEALELADRTRSRALARKMSSNLGPGDGPKVGAGMTFAQMVQLARSHKLTIVEYTVIYQYDPDLLLEMSGFADRAVALLVWVIKEDGSLASRRVEMSSEPQSLAELVTAARASVGSNNRGFFALSSPGRSSAVSDLHRLHDILIEPIRSLLPGGPDRPVLFVPQDSLFFVPFAALQDAGGRHLIERITPVIAQSVRVFDLAEQEQHRVASQGGGALVVGNPTMPKMPDGLDHAPRQLSPLPHAELEARGVAELFGARPLLGPMATKDGVLARITAAKTVHLATHGIADRQQGGYFGAVALAPSGGDSGLLTVEKSDG